MSADFSKKILDNSDKSKFSFIFTSPDFCYMDNADFFKNNNFTIQAV